MLGIVAEISLANLFVDLGCRLTGQGGPERFAELREIPWMKGLRKLPAAAVPIVAALAGAVEEVFFRGVLLLVLTTRLRGSHPPRRQLAIMPGCCSCSSNWFSFVPRFRR